MYIRVPTPHTLGESLESYEGPFTRSLGLTATTSALEAMTCRLLCASNLAYAPGPQATSPYYTDPAHLYYYTKAGFIDRPDVIGGAGTKGIDSCLIGTVQGSSDSEPNNVVLAFRGTLPPGASSASYFSAMMQDWLNDFEAVLVPFTKIPSVLVHKGFNDTVNSFFGRGIVRAIQARLKSAKPGSQLYITGHSKGGAIAHLAALLLRTMHPEIPLGGVISFEAPRAGHTNFVAAYNDLKINSLRYEFMDDIVPHLPQSGIIAKLLAINPVVTAALSTLYPKSVRTLTFEHVGELRFIDWFGRIVKDSQSLQVGRIAKVSALLVPTLGTAILPLLATQHPMGCGTKAWKVICQTEVCK